MTETQNNGSSNESISLSIQLPDSLKVNKKVAAKVAISDNVISAAVAPSIDEKDTEEIKEIANDLILSSHEKIEKLHEYIDAKQNKLKTITQRAAQVRYLDAIETARQFISLLKSSDEIDGDGAEDDDEDIDVFDAITYNTKLVALKKSNALIVTGDAGAGKTHTVKEAIAFLNPIRESIIVDADYVEETTEEDIEEAPIEEETPTEVEETPEDPNTIKLPEVLFKVKNIKKPKEAKEVRAVVNSNNNHDSGYYIAKGTCSAAGLYELLFIHRHKLLIFDDFDSVLKDDDCVNYLKAALDTYTIREISKMRASNAFNSLGMTDAEMWDEYEITGKVPNQFRFTGNIIFISNIHEDKFDKALISRALHVEVRLSKAQMIDRMKSLMMDIRPECPLDWKLDALHHLEYLTSNYVCKFELNLRELIHFIDIRKGFPDDVIVLNGKSVALWKQLAKKRIVKSKLRK